MKKILSIIALIIAVTTALAFGASAATLYDEAADGRGKVVETPVGCQDFTVTFKINMTNAIEEGTDGYTGQFLMVYLSDKAEFASDETKFNVPAFRVMNRHLQNVCGDGAATPYGGHGHLVDFGGKNFNGNGAMTFELKLKDNVLYMKNLDAANIEAAEANWMINLTYPDGTFSADKPMYLVFDNHGSQGVSVSDLTIVSTDYTAPVEEEPAVQTGYAVVPVIALGAAAVGVIAYCKKKH